MPIIQGKSYYTWLVNPDTAFGTSKWKISVLLDEANKAKAKELGLSIKGAAGAIPGDHVTFIRKTTNRAGAPVAPPGVIDAKKNEVPEAVIKTIGNGSDVKVKFSVIPNKMAKNGQVTYLEKVQLIELVPYVRGDGFDEEDGFSSEEFLDTADNDDEFDSDKEVTTTTNKVVKKGKTTDAFED